MKKSEEWARVKLSERLTKRGLKFSSIEGGNPPDLSFTVEGEEHAIEVTELHQYIDVGGETSTLTVENYLLGLVKKIDNETAKRSLGYIVTLKGPITNTQARKILSEAKSHILASNSEILRIGENSECELTPLTNGDTGLRSIIIVNATTKTPDEKAILADIQGSIDYALGRILSEKVPRLAQFKSVKKRALVIVSEYPFADCENVYAGLQKRSGQIAPIDEIYLAWDDSFELVFP
jgi:hypothetical protein